MHFRASPPRKGERVGEQGGKYGMWRPVRVGDPIKDRAGLFFHREGGGTVCKHWRHISREISGQSTVCNFCAGECREMVFGTIGFISTEATYVNNFFRQGTM